MLADEAGPEAEEEDFVPDHLRQRSRYAERLHIDEADVALAEAGQLDWEQLPPALAFAVRRN